MCKTTVSAESSFVVLTKTPDMREAILDPTDQSICQSNSDKQPPSVPHGAEVPSQALSTSLTHKMVRLVKMVVLTQDAECRGGLLDRNQ